ncbi:hypothetical protein ACOMHN_033403 [Nucella lapillus]
MSLLLLKTRDLTWQDHTLNTEVMLAPARSGLLLNKHKTLGAKCQMDKQLYERQRAQCIKDFLFSRRLIDRRRQKLVNRQRELRCKQARATSALPTHNPDTTEEAEAAILSKERSASAPGGGSRVKMELPAIYIDTGAVSPDPSDSSSLFVTEMGDAPFPSFPVPTRIPMSSTPFNTNSAPGRSSWRNRTPVRDTTPTRNRTPTRNNITPTRNRTPTKSTTPTPNKTLTRETGSSTNQGPFPRPLRSFSVFDARPSRAHTPQKSDSKPSVTVRFADGDTEEKEEDDPKTKQDPKDTVLEAKVRAFIDDIKDFTTDRKLGKTPKNQRSEGFALFERRCEPPSPAKTPLVAKRYNAFSVEQTELLSAFEQFCNVQTPEELTKAMRLASKLKANVKVTRNQSIVPSIATYKSTRAFKTLNSRDSNNM